MEFVNRLASNLSSSVSSTVFSTVSTIKDVLPGNPVTREFEVTSHIASAGPCLIWKVYSGFKKSTKHPAAIFVLEKRSLDRFDRQEKEFLLDLYRKSISQLTRLRHPQILTVQHPLEESRDCLAFATEPVFCSLANVLGRCENMPSPVPPALREYKLFDVEIKYGLMQLSEGLAFLHDGVKMLHRNVAPESVVINHQGAWKIFGFDFAISNSAPANQSPAWRFPDYTHNTPAPEGYPDLDFLAPEFALSGQCTVAADMFSLGMLAFALFNTKPLFCNSGNWGVYKKNACELKSLRESNLHLIPSDLRDYLKMTLSVTPELRPTAAQFAKIGFFEDVGVKTLTNLDSQFQWDNLQKSQFYRGLPAVLPKLPHRVALHRVVPCLAKEYVNPSMVPFVLPAVLQIAEEASKQDFVQYVLPDLKPVMKITDPVQILLIFMQRMEMLLSKTPPTDVKNDVLPMIYRALESDASQIQELCLSIIPGFAGLLDYQAMKNALLPRIKKLCVSTTLLSVRVNSLICLGKLLTHLDKWLVIDEVLPMLQQIPSREPAVVMGIIGIYKMTLGDDKLGLTKEVIATKALPFLFPLSIENGLTLNQYNVIMSLIRQMITKVEDEHKIKLEQLNSLQDEQRSALQISMSEGMQIKPNQLIPTSSSSSAQSEMDDMFAGLGLGSYVQKKDTASIATGMMPGTGSSSQQASSLSSSSAAMMTGQGTTTTSLPGMGTGSMSLEEKRRLVQQTDSMRMLQSQPQLMPSAKTPAMTTSGGGGGGAGGGGTKDLTSMLMERNLSQMKTSQTFDGSAGFQNLNSANFPSSNSFSSQFPGGGGGGSNSNAGNNSWGNFVQPAAASPSGFQASPQAPKPDLSAFDSLLQMPSAKSRQPMGAFVSAPPTAAPQRLMSPPSASSASAMMPSSTNQVNTLSSNDINDLLG